jgi:putative nucleotidyltransferase with HDIG domain
MHKLESLLERSDELPSLPEIYLRVSELLESDYSTVQQIGKAIQTDPILTGRILKMINSAYYGLATPVTSIAQAVSLLGRQQLSQFLMGSVVAGVFSDAAIANFPMREFWEHSVKTAIIARHLAMQNVHIIDHEAFFTSGLLHDIGRLVIARVAPDLLAEVERRKADSEIDVLQLEAELLGVTHVDVGEALMKKWGMPSLITQCVIRHHAEQHSGPFAMDTSIVFLANLLSRYPVESDDEELLALLTTLANWEQTGCSLEQINIACQLADEQWVEVMDLLGMSDGRPDREWL